MGANGRPWYFWPLIAFVVGLLLGWLVIGWGLWPVTWTNATVQDLRPELRMDYVRMAAESYERTGNLELARQRLAGWPPEDLSQVFTETLGVLAARDPAAAASVQRLSVAVGATQAAGQAGAGQAPQPQPTAPGTATGGAAEQPSRLRQICTAGIFIILALGALAALYFLFRRWRAAQAPEEEDMAPLEPGSGLSSQSQADLAAEREKRRPLSMGADRTDLGTVTTVGPTVRTDLDRAAGRDWAADDNGSASRSVTGRAASPRPVGPLAPTPGRSEPAEPRTPQQGLPPPSASPTAGLQVLVENTAVYQMGEPDYDEAFDINDPVDGYMGQCGLQLIEPFGRERDQAVALQVWLWDSSDPDTQTLVLMSEGAYRDTALRSQYSGEHQAMSVRPGAEFELNSHDLLLKGRVEKVSYAEVEPVRGVFADLHVKLTVYRRS